MGSDASLENEVKFLCGAAPECCLWRIDSVLEEVLGAISVFMRLEGAV